MKAKAGLLTLLVLLISFAGFGKTTPDPGQNPNPEVVQMDDSENVVMEVENKYQDAAVIAAEKTDAEVPNRFDELFKEADLAFDKQYQEVLIMLAVPPNLGEKRYCSLKPLPDQCSCTRNPRDGIRCI